ncbi:sodium-dependent transporter [Marinomonas mediterranea]|uniref:sodium-dependent transporter n=1 Tax=Marinomonas mediterranea TaxID=119864 RepID=UPI00234B0E55|nr:sodium-dependent transporter [Marinomonas mediterranea]WCN08389.1 sodium-dependent transporter [Marinomonas mediterranea]WCN12445.1 sodium-dependent transporter [Marinomonas mediterranea]
MQNKMSIQGSWASRWIFILAATGSAVGLGNIWKFPYITGENGGGAFVLVYLVCILFVGIPIMMTEVFIGRRARRNPIGALESLSEESNTSTAWKGIGLIGMLAGVFIFSFYSVVAGWVLQYIQTMATGGLNGATSEQAGAYFNGLLADPQTLLIWHSIFTAMVIVVVAAGVNKGLERATRIMMPALFVLLLVLLGYAMSTDGFAAGWNFMFEFDFSKLSWDAVLVALGHSFFTLSLGMGTIMAYGAYMPKKASVGGTVLAIGALDTIVALIAGLAIFPIIFSNGMDPAAGPGLMFISLPVAFGQMAFGQFFGLLFFILIGIAAWTSAISLMEPTVAFLVEKFGMKRLNATVLLGIVCWAMGITCVGSFNFMSDYTLFGKNAFDFLDFITANIMMPLGGILIALFAGWAVKEQFAKEEIGVSDIAFSAWKISIRFVAPIAVTIVFVYNLL